MINLVVLKLLGRTTFFTLLSFPFIAQADSSLDENSKDKLLQLKESCSGVLYRSKKDEIPVYAEPDETAQVVYRLKLGEKVCYIGEKGSFAILNWESFLSSEERELSKEKLAYSRLVDLWPPKDGSGKKEHLPGLAGFFSKARSIFQRMGYGHPPEDALEPYEPIIGPFKNNDPQPAQNACETSIDCDGSSPEAK